jgi:hypothetical protein
MAGWRDHSRYYFHHKAFSAHETSEGGVSLLLWGTAEPMHDAPGADALGGILSPSDARELAARLLAAADKAEAAKG